MDVPRLLIRSEVRRQRGALIALAVLVALGIGAGIAAFSIASRTDAAYPDYLRPGRRSRVQDQPGRRSARGMMVAGLEPGCISAR